MQWALDLRGARRKGAGLARWARFGIARNTTEFPERRPFRGATVKGAGHHKARMLHLLTVVTVAVLEDGEARSLTVAASMR